MRGKERLWLRLLFAAVFALVLSGLQVPEALADESAEVRTLLARGWTFLENGDMRQAEEAFSSAFDTQVGRNTAETYYAIAAIWWERRNAMAAYMWLSDGVKTARESYSWDGGEGQEWDRRIGGRKRFIENNFTIAKLRAPRGKALPPLADPPPLDPVLREFAEMLPRVVAEGTEAKVELQWVLLPNGSYWVGADLQQLTGGELEPRLVDPQPMILPSGNPKPREVRRKDTLGDVSGAPQIAAQRRQSTLTATRLALPAFKTYDIFEVWAPPALQKNLVADQ